MSDFGDEFTCGFDRDDDDDDDNTSPAAPGDTMEPNDSLATASNLAAAFQNSGTTGALRASFSPLSIAPVGDRDFFCFAVTVLSSLNVTVAFNHSQGDLVLDLSCQGPVPATWHANTVTDNEQVLVGSADPGKYCIDIQGAINATTQSHYELIVEMTPLVAAPKVGPSDAYENNDSVLNATDIVLGVTGNASLVGLSINALGDLDFFCFQLQGAASYRVDVNATFVASEGDLDIDILGRANSFVYFQSSASTDNEAFNFAWPLERMWAQHYSEDISAGRAQGNESELCIRVYGAHWYVNYV